MDELGLKNENRDFADFHFIPFFSMPCKAKGSLYLYHIYVRIIFQYMDSTH